MGRNELRIVIGLHRMVNEIDRKTGRLLQPYHLTLGQFAVLEALYHKGDMTIGQVQEKILSSSGTIPLIIQNLEKRKLLRRLKNEKDRRVCMLQLSEEGRWLIEEVYPKNEAMIFRELGIYSLEEQEELVRLFKKYKEEQDG